MVGGKYDKPYITIDGFSGTGKTYLLSIAIKYLHRVFQDSFFKSLLNKYKILVITKDPSSANRIASLLLKQMKEFVIFGNLKDIPPYLLPFSFHSSGGASQNITILKDVLKKTMKSSTKHYLETSIKQLVNGVTKQLLHNAFAVITSIDQILANMLTTYKFQLVIFDDCESMSELQSSAVLSRFRVPNIIMSVDTISSDLQDTTFFNRIMKNKASYHTKFTTQYKFNPKITALLNNVFYDNQLKDGVNLNNFNKLVKGLPSFCIYESSGNELELFDGSFANESEATLIADLLNLIVTRGIPGINILVCTATISQIKYIKAAINNIRMLDRSDLKCVEVTSMENIQKFDKQIVICSFVRSTNSYSKFLCNKKWLISLLCSGRNHVVFVGNRFHLSSFDYVKSIIEFTTTKKNIYSSFNIKKLWKKLNCENIRKTEDEVPLITFTSKCSENCPDDENIDEAYKKVRHQVEEDRKIFQKTESDSIADVLINKSKNAKFKVSLDSKECFKESEKVSDSHLMEYKTLHEDKNNKKLLQTLNESYQSYSNSTVDSETTNNDLSIVEQQSFNNSIKSCFYDKFELKEDNCKVSKKHLDVVDEKIRNFCEKNETSKCSLKKDDDCTRPSKVRDKSAPDQIFTQNGLLKVAKNTFIIDNDDDIDCDFNLDDL